LAGQEAPAGLDKTVDFKRWTVDADLRVQFYGIMGLRRLEFTWDTMCKGLSGAIVVVDSTAPEALPEVQYLLDFLMGRYEVPIVIAATKQDVEGALSPEALRAQLRLREGVPVVPCVATKWASVKQVLLVLFYAMRRELERPRGTTSAFRSPR